MSATLESGLLPTGRLQGAMGFILGAKAMGFGSFDDSVPWRWW